jgi:hypothetical protein
MQSLSTTSLLESIQKYRSKCMRSDWKDKKIRAAAQLMQTAMLLLSNRTW